MGAVSKIIVGINTQCSLDMHFFKECGRCNVLLTEQNNDYLINLIEHKIINNYRDKVIGNCESCYENEKTKDCGGFINKLNCSSCVLPMMFLNDIYDLFNRSSSISRFYFTKEDISGERDYNFIYKLTDLLPEHYTPVFLFDYVFYMDDRLDTKSYINFKQGTGKKWEFELKKSKDGRCVKLITNEVNVIGSSVKH